jgi:hypothetical protein
MKKVKLLWCYTLRRRYRLARVTYTLEGLTAARRARGTSFVVLHALAGGVLRRIENALAVVLVLEDAGGSGDAWDIALAGSAVAV